MAGNDSHYYEPANGHGLAHDPLLAIVGPRPIGWISSVNKAGAYNLAPYSFFNAFNYRPPIIGFSSVGWKDSVKNIKETGEFVWNLTTRTLAEAMNTTSTNVSPEVDEFVLANLTAAPSRLVNVPRVLESPVNFECRLTQLIQLTRADGATVETWLVLGEVVAVHIDRTLINDGTYDTCAAHPVVRAGKFTEYVEITAQSMFHMARPDAATYNALK